MRPSRPSRAPAPGGRARAGRRCAAVHSPFTFEENPPPPEAPAPPVPPGDAGTEGTGVRPERNSSIPTSRGSSASRRRRTSNARAGTSDRRSVPSDSERSVRRRRSVAYGVARAKSARVRGAVLGEAGRRKGAGIGGEAHRAADESRQVVQRRARVRAGRVELGAALEDARAVAREDRREERDERRPVGRSEERGDVRGRHAAARARRGLVEEREPVAEAAGRRGGQRPEGRALDERRALLRRGRRLDDREALAPRDVGEPVGDLVVRQAPEVEALAAREDRRRDLVALGRREDEDGVGRRLLERLEEGLERGRRDRVDLVDDEDLAAVPRRARRRRSR